MIDMHIFNHGRLFAIFALDSNNNGTMSYVIKDHQGSMYATVTGNSVERYSFDAWGRRRNPQTLSYDNVTTSFDRGYTLHEHYDDFGFINMNGRVYDPYLSTFLSPDNYIQCPDNSQNFNRYAYCLNNPLKYTDPSGEDFIVAAIIIGGAIGVASTVGVCYTSGVNPWNGKTFKYYYQEESSDFFKGTRYSEKVLNQMQEDSFHGFPKSVEAFQQDGYTTIVTGGDKINRTLLHIPGSYKGYDGEFYS